ncbi:hypothetical protein D3C71_2216850 [compost metagenome]
MVALVVLGTGSDLHDGRNTDRRGVILGLDGDSTVEGGEDEIHAEVPCHRGSLTL